MWQHKHLRHKVDHLLQRWERWLPNLSPNNFSNYTRLLIRRIVQVSQYVFELKEAHATLKACGERSGLIQRDLEYTYLLFLYHFLRSLFTSIRCPAATARFLSRTKPGMSSNTFCIHVNEVRLCLRYDARHSNYNRPPKDESDKAFCLLSQNAHLA